MATRSNLGHGLVAQLVEQLPLKETVQGSIPCRPTQMHSLS